ncbi:MAG: PDGLE domain-containing protein [Anaerolineales bacterium]|nr:PDGLE domain-containing protein [Anaerolineales bacterium]
MYSPVPMHIPDGFLSVLVSLVLWALTLPVLAISLIQLNRNLEEREVPLLGVLAAAIFAGQMLNFTVVGGTSGHLMGAAIATILVGPWAAIVVMTAVVATQALIFQDGGLLALGGNLFNMAVIGVAVAYLVYRSLMRVSGGKQWGIFVGGFLASWFSIFIASLAVGLQLAASGTSPANIALPAMAGIHALIGIGEGLITLGTLAFVYAVRRDLLRIGEPQPAGSRGILIIGFFLALVLAVFSPLASSHPDGLEWVAEQRGFIDTARNAPYNIIPDYVFPGIQNEAAATIIAGILGVLIVTTVTIGVSLARRKKSTESNQ